MPAKPLPDQPFGWDDGTVAVYLHDDHREILGIVLGACRRILAGDPSSDLLWRLSPPAHPDDPEAEAAYRELVGDDLAAQRLQDLRTFEETIGGDKLDEAAVSAWTRTLSGFRLMMSGRGDGGFADGPPEEALDGDDPRLGVLAAYDWTGYLLEALVAAAQQGLDQQGLDEAC